MRKVCTQPVPGQPQAPSDVADGVADELDASDRRRSTREPVLTPGMLRQLDVLDAQIVQVMVTDVSLHGVGFRSPKSIESGDDAMYCIEIGVGPLHLTSRLRVVRVRARADGSYDIGGEFC